MNGSLHGPTLFNLQADPVILAKAPHFSNLVIGKHAEQTHPHLVESWPTLQGPQGRVVENGGFAMKLQKLFFGSLVDAVYPCSLNESNVVCNCRLQNASKYRRGNPSYNLDRDSEG